VHLLVGLLTGSRRLGRIILLQVAASGWRDTAGQTSATVEKKSPQAQFAAEVQRLAQIASAAFRLRKHATIATTWRDDSPRNSGTDVDFADDEEIYVGMMPGTKRARDTRRDPRVAVHCPTVDPPADNPADWLGDGKSPATAVEVEPDRLRLDIHSATLTAVAPGGDELAIITWHEGRGTTVVRRR